jgi:hypothetical protein
MTVAEKIVGQQIGAVDIEFVHAGPEFAIVKCYNGLDKKHTYFNTTLENGKAIDDWLVAGRPGLIQNALPQLTVDEREQCLSGIDAEAWDAMFGEE